ncbi:related to chromate transport protein [Phialocephala subalpina]|uniref:Related to chromate transport protein n=1 Tax=Phialocephala subalpina TaxID=576137 RepID=A0A1L7XGC7_9HELO|nr:related to chromate transport protein [Phialocephala subalpina]
MLSVTRRFIDSIQIDTSAIWTQTKDVLAKNWHLGFTAFGGPPVHFQIYHKKFVQKYKRIDEQLVNVSPEVELSSSIETWQYQELFALSQALPGPASTKMLFCINYIHGGFLAGLGAFALWWIGEELPAPVYALLSGLNAATVGIIALAAVQLSEKAITDKLTRALVFLGGVAGMLYAALWYFPILMTASGLATVVWDYKWLQRTFKPSWRRRRASVHTSEEDSGVQHTTATASDPNTQDDDPESSLHLRRIPPLELASGTDTERPDAVLDSDLSARVVPSGIQLKIISWKTGMFVIIGFFLSFITVMVTRSLLKSPPLALSLFSNLYLAGTIIFGGGPVVIPLLREYIVSPGWVSPRNFLLGLALNQSFPGPKFNFAVYLGALSLLLTLSSAPSSASSASLRPE